MNFYLHLTLLIVAILLVSNGEIQTKDKSICGNWLPYRDEKCFKVLEGLRSFEDAQSDCAVIENGSSLVIVRSKDEQNFLSNFLFKTLKEEDNFWIGATYSTDEGHFKWWDDSDLAYKNWDAKGVTNRENHCVQIQADVRVIGKWIDQPCGKSNKVVCQKMQTWSTARLQKAVLDERKLTRDALESTNQRLGKANEKIRNLERNPVPIGFIYVQLPHQPEPQILWPTVQWKNVTSEYAGLFFRAEGPNTAAFGSVQEGNAPRVTQVRFARFGKIRHEDWYNTNLIAGGWSSGIGVYSGSWTPKEMPIHQFHQSGGEIRPQNMAMRIWKRV